MRVEDLNLKELLELDPEGGKVRFAGQRALIFDAVSQGLLRKELIEYLRGEDRPGHPQPLRLHPRAAPGRDPEKQIQMGHGRGLEKSGRPDLRPAGSFHAGPGWARHIRAGGRHLAGFLRGRTAPAPHGPLGFPGVLEPVRADQRLFKFHFR